MKVCDVAQSRSNPDDGVRTYLREKRAFVRRMPDVEHVLIIPGERDSETRSGRLAVYTVRASLVPGSARNRFTFRLDKIVRILERERPHVLEFGCAYVMPHAGFSHRRRHRCALVGFYHTDYPTATVKNILAKQLGKAAGERGRRWAERHAWYIYNRFQMTAAPSKAMAARLHQLEIRNIEHVPLGVNPIVFHPKRRDLQLREFLDAGSADTIFAYAGGLDADGRLETILEAVRLSAAESGWRFLFIGEGPLKRRIQALGSLDPRMRVMPYERNRLRLARLLASCDVYVSARPSETSGLTIAEAQASGLAVIGVDSVGMRECVPQGTGMLAPPDNAEGLLRCMKALAAGGVRGMGRAARGWALSRCSWKTSFERLFGFYERLAAEHA